MDQTYWSGTHNLGSPVFGPGSRMDDMGTTALESRGVHHGRITQGQIPRFVILNIEIIAFIR